MKERILKTAYDWCLEGNIRVLDLSQWKKDSINNEKDYFTEQIDLSTFYEFLESCKVKSNSRPRKTDMYLEYRMYGLVNYQLSGTIHAGIQFGHAVVDYGQSIKGMGKVEDVYNKWANEDKTFIILNGGTTNINPNKLGGLNQHLITLKNNGVLCKDFYEPDLGDQLTAICFLVDERVWNKELYEDFEPEVLPWSKQKQSEKKILDLEKRNKINYQHWITKIGGETNAFLRSYLRPLRLA